MTATLTQTPPVQLKHHSAIKIQVSAKDISVLGVDEEQYTNVL